MPASSYFKKFFSYSAVLIALGISIFAVVISYTYVDKETIIREVTPDNQADIDAIQNAQADLLEAVNALITRVENSEGTQADLLEAARSLSARVENSEGTTNDLLEATDTLADRLGNAEVPAYLEQAFLAVAGATVSINNAVPGTGFIYDSSGLIITTSSALVDSLGRTRTFVNLTINQNVAGESVVRGTVLGINRSKGIGVVKINPADGDFMTARLGLNSNVRVGQTVIAVGTPFGYYENTLTRGVISGLNRRVADAENTRIRSISTLIQTDTSINPGGLGSPLANLNGEVIGVAILTRNVDGNGGDIGINFALPIGEAKEIADAIVAANPG